MKFYFLFFFFRSKSMLILHTYLKGQIGWLKEQKVEVEIGKIKIRFIYNTNKSNSIRFHFFVFSFLFDFLIRFGMTF